MNFYLIPIAFLISYISTPITIKLAQYFKVTTDASSSSHPAHTHTGILPRWGGIPILLAVSIPLLFAFVDEKIVVFLLTGAFITAITGLIDDKYNLSPYLRFFLNILAAGVVVAGGVGIPFISNPINGIIDISSFTLNFIFFGNSYTILWLADILAIVWIVWCMNMVNWSKGVDGQLPGFVAISAVVLGFLAFRFSRHDIAKETVTIIAFVTAAAYAGFLPWNFFPQRILPGYGAGSLAGFLLGVLAILSWGKVGTMLLVLALPFTDAVLVFIRRVAAKKSPFKGDRSHFHHILLDLGWGRRRIAVFYWLVSAIMGIFALMSHNIEKIFGFAVVFIILALMVVWAYYLRKSAK